MTSFNFHFQSLIGNSLHCFLYNSDDVRMENLVLDQQANPLIDIFFIVITCQLDITLIFEGEILPWSLIRV